MAGSNIEKNVNVPAPAGPMLGESRPGKLRQLLNANAKKKPANRRKRKVKVAHAPASSGSAKMPPPTDVRY